MPSSRNNRAILFDDAAANIGRIEIDVADDDFTVFPAAGASQSFLGTASDELKAGLQDIVSSQAAGAPDPDGDGVTKVDNKSFTLVGALPGGGDVAVTHNPTAATVQIGAIPPQSVAQFGYAVVIGMTGLGL